MYCITLCCPWCVHVFCYGHFCFSCFFLVRDPFILAHAIGALLYLCIHCDHWSVQHQQKKRDIQGFYTIKQCVQDANNQNMFTNYACWKAKDIVLVQ